MKASVFDRSIERLFNEVAILLNALETNLKLLGMLVTDVLRGDEVELTDDEVEAAITAVRGFGRWSAHMYMMFSLGRPDIWPSGDLAVRVGFGRMMGWKERPDEKKVIDEGDAFSPYRSALALLCWQFYSEAPL